jgi:hypothetical protein
MIITPIPYYKHILKSPLSKLDIENRLNNEISQTKTLFVWRQPNNEKFFGFMSAGKFKIIRFGTIRNSFKPVIFGTLNQDENGTTIELVFRPHLLVLIFVGVWCSFVLYAATFSIQEIVMNDHYDPLILIPFGMLAFAYLILMIGFIPDVNYSIKIFEELFFTNGLYHRVKA